MVVGARINAGRQQQNVPKINTGPLREISAGINLGLGKQIEEAGKEYQLGPQKDGSEIV
jgi:hypothetical protein